VQLGSTTPAEFTQEQTLSVSADSTGIIWDAASLSDGTYVMARLETSGGEVRVVTERFSSGGAAIGSPTTWATYGDISSTEPMGLAITAISNGNFVVAWSRPDGIYLRQATPLSEAVGDLVHLADSTMSGEELDLLETSDGTLIVAWSNYARTAIVGQHLGIDLVAHGALLTLVESPAGRSVSNPLLVAHPIHSYGLRWTEGEPYLPGGGTTSEPPDRFGGSTGPEYSFHLQLLDASGTATSAPIGLGANPTGVAPGVAVSPWGDFATAETQWTGGETIISLNLRDAFGQINTTYELSRSRFIGFTSPQITMLPDGGFVVTYGTPYADGPLIQSQQYNTSAIPIGDIKQFNVGDDVGYPPQLRVLPLGEFSYAVAWPHRLLTDTTSSVSSRKARLATTPLEIALPSDVLAAIDASTAIVRIAGIPTSAELTAGSLAADGNWYLPLEQLAGLQLVGDGPWSASLWKIELLDTQSTAVLYSEEAWVTTRGDDIISPLASTFAYYGGEGNDTFVVPFRRDELELIRLDEASLELRETDSELALWQLNGFERVRFSDISLPIEWLLHELEIPDSPTYLTTEDTSLTISPSDGLLGYQVQPFPFRSTAYLIEGAQHGELSLSTSGSFVYTPSENWHGSDTWAFDTRSMIFHGAVEADRNGDYFVADHVAGLPTMDFSALPNDLQDGHAYTVTLDITEFEGDDVAFQFALIGGNSLIAAELGATEITSGTTGTLTFHFVKQPSHAGFTFYSTASSTESIGRLRFTNFIVADTTVGEIIVNSSIPDYWPRHATITTDAIADVPVASIEALVGATHDPIDVIASAELVDRDGSEQLRLELMGLPSGASITDGVHSATSTDAAVPIDITQWNATQLQIELPADFRGTFELTLHATAIELSNSHAATYSQSALIAPEYDDPPVDDPPVDDPPVDAPPVDNPGEGSESGPTFPGILATMFASSGGPSSTEGGMEFLATGYGAGWDFGDLAAMVDGLDYGIFSAIDGIWNAWGQGGSFGANSAASPLNTSPENSANESPSEGAATPGGESPLESGVGEDSGDDGGGDENGPVAVPLIADSASDNGDAMTASESSGIGDLVTSAVDEDERLAAPSGLTPSEESRRSLVDAAMTMPGTIEPHSRDVVAPAVGAAETQTYIVNGNIRVPAIFAADALWREVDDVTHGLETTPVAANVAVGSAVIVASGFSAAQVLWLLRGSVLATKLMSSMPVWIAFDPLPVLDAQTARRGKRKHPLANESLADIASS
jgi:hypothetical protein